MSKEREELEKNKAEQKKSNLKSNLFKALDIIIVVAAIIWGTKSKKS